MRALAELELAGMRRLQVLQKKYRDLVDDISHGVIWAAEPTSTLMTFVSPSAEELLGYSSEQWMAAGFFLAHVPAEEEEWVRTKLKDATPNGPPVVFEHRFHRWDGSTAWLQTSVRSGEGANGASELHGLSVDLTPQKQAENALRLLAHTSHELSVSLDLQDNLSRLLHLVVPEVANWAYVELVSETDEGTVAHLHGFAERPWSLTLSLLCNTPVLWELGDPDASRNVTSLLTVRSPEVLEGIAHTPAQLRYLRELAPHTVVVVPLCAGVRCFGRLILGLSAAERRADAGMLPLMEELGRRAGQAIDNARLYREVQDTVRVREDFLSIASHELRTPLTPVLLHLASLERLLGQNGAPSAVAEEATRRIASIKRQTERLTRLVESLLDVSRIRAGRLELELEEMDLGELVQDVVSRFREEVAREDVRLNIEVPEGLKGHWDRSRIDQVLTNLVSNALKYGKRQPVDIRATEVGDRVVVAVQDRGIGIAGNNPERVFARFERAVDARSFSGLGLGLYIVQQLVHAHGGTISLHTQAGEGSTLTVDLPKKAMPPAEMVRKTG
jgi:PAS domain S-box-containing protein